MCQQGATRPYWKPRRGVRVSGGDRKMHCILQHRPSRQARPSLWTPSVFSCLFSHHIIIKNLSRTCFNVQSLTGFPIMINGNQGRKIVRVWYIIPNPYFSYKKIAIPLSPEKIMHILILFSHSS